MALGVDVKAVLNRMGFQIGHESGDIDGGQGTAILSTPVSLPHLRAQDNGGSGLYHVTMDRSASLLEAIREGIIGHDDVVDGPGIKPGWVRVNFNYFITEEMFEFILEAVRQIADRGWKLLHRHRFDPTTGLWHHRAGRTEPPLSLQEVRYVDGRSTYPRRRRHEPESRLADHTTEARRILTAASDPPAELPPLELSRDFEHLRWFPLPGEQTAGTPT